MTKIQENRSVLAALLTEVKKHCMCAKFEDVGGKFLVIYPPGYFPNGRQASKAIKGGKAEALRRMLAAMESHWKNAQL